MTKPTAWTKKRGFPQIPQGANDDPRYVPQPTSSQQQSTFGSYPNLPPASQNAAMLADILTAGGVQATQNGTSIGDHAVNVANGVRDFVRPERFTFSNAMNIPHNIYAHASNGIAAGIDGARMFMDPQQAPNPRMMTRDIDPKYAQGSFDAAGLAATGGIGASAATKAVPKEAIGANAIRAYHGTQSAPFKKFDASISELGPHFGTAKEASNFAGNKGHVMPVDLHMQNTVRMPDMGMWSPTNVYRELQKQGIEFYDDQQRMLNAHALEPFKHEYFPDGLVDQQRLRDLMQRYQDNIDALPQGVPGIKGAEKALTRSLDNFRAVKDAGYQGIIPDRASGDRMIRQTLMDNGRDGIVYKNTMDLDRGQDAYIAIKPGTVTSPYTGDTLFSSGVPGIYMSEDERRQMADALEGGY